MHWGGLNLFRQKIEEPAFSKLSGDGRWVVVRMKKNPCVISNLMYSGLVKWCHPRTGKMIIMFRLNTNTSTRALYKRKTTKPYQQQVYTNHFRVIKQKKLIDYPGIIHYTSLFAVGSPYKTTIPPFHWKKAPRPDLQLRLLRYNRTSVQLPTLGAGQMPELPNPDPPFFGTCVNFSI